ncbi:MAG: PrsW family intramembrane metalloprotease [Spirochaetales bacterium]|nr:PrsW family intramembrane metalloprotease [Spirochaetales bacterium]
MAKSKVNFLNTGVLNIIFLGILYAISYFLLKDVAIGIHSIWGTLVILVIALVPTVLWVLFYYVIDRKDPEPVFMIVAAFIAGIVCKLIFHDFIGKVLFDVEAWNINETAIPFLFTLFARGLLPALSIFFILRYVIYPSKYFNEPVDGMIYSAVIGIGYAFTMTMSEVFTAQSVSLYYLLFTLILKLLLFSSCCTLIGYYFGVARFKEEKKELYFGISLIILFVVFSLYAFFDNTFKINIQTSSDFTAIILTLVFSIVIFAVAYILIQRSIAKHEAKEVKALPFSIDKVSLITLIVILVLGMGIRVFIERDKTFVSYDNKISFHIPAAYKLDSENNDSISFSRQIPGDVYPVMIKIAFIQDETVILVGADFEKDKMIAGYNFSLDIKREPVNTNPQTGLLGKSRQGEIFSANIFEYNLIKEGKKIIVSFISPFDYHEDPFALVTKIVQSLKWEV